MALRKTKASLCRKHSFCRRGSFGSTFELFRSRIPGEVYFGSATAVGKMPIGKASVPAGFPKTCPQNTCGMKMIPPEWHEARECWGILVKIIPRPVVGGCIHYQVR